MSKIPWTYRYDLALWRQDTGLLPECPGVYFFLDAADEILYIGKATSLRDRVRSYFSGDISETRGPKIVLMLERAQSIAYCEMDSVLEALFLESRLIKVHQPVYNTDEKDDKSFNHVVITAEDFPRVLVVRGRDFAQGKFRDPIRKIFGPFPAGTALREVMKIIRRIFPFRDMCTPGSGKACFSSQVGLCPGVCVGTLSAAEYRKIIRRIELFFEGKKNALVRGIERDMKHEAEILRFEEAARLKRQLFALLHIQDVSLVKDDLKEMKPHRIEAYDVAHLGGTETVGVMTVIERGRPNKDEYRQFVLRGEHGGNDLSALEEVLTRRFGHSEWPLPEILVVDGSLLQRVVAERILSAFGFSIPILGVVKDARHQPDHLIGPEGLRKRFESEALLGNAEAHRFALALHRKRRRKALLA
ncbi:MAG: GIY-YIG nuclease family protein [Candidatus Moranbacteria bacterium]|nr:GIY-YIG nuclease family protein [Candidatus Moranbacteria bacterium]